MVILTSSAESSDPGDGTTHTQRRGGMAMTARIEPDLCDGALGVPPAAAAEAQLRVVPKHSKHPASPGATRDSGRTRPRPRGRRLMHLSRQGLQRRSIPALSSDGLCIVSAPAEIDISNADEFRAALMLASQRGSTVVVDMSHTVYCDCRAINVLAGASRVAAAEGVELRLAACRAPVMRILSITGADQLLVLCASLADAQSGSRSNAPRPSAEDMPPCTAEG